MPLPDEHLLDELATAYVQAIAAVAGATIAVSRRDYGVDGTLKHVIRAGNKYIESGYPIDFQLKGTTTAVVGPAIVVYDLKVRNYNLLVQREQAATPYYLFLVCFAEDPSRWIVEEQERLIIGATAFWWRRSADGSHNASTVRIGVPLTQQLRIGAMRQILDSAKRRLVQ